VAAGSCALRLIGAMLVLAVAGCSGPPWVTAVSPDLVALRWYTNQTPIFATAAVAQAHCASLGKTAVLVSDQESGGAQMARYDCR
jgi:putative hemolysin